MAALSKTNVRAWESCCFCPLWEGQSIIFSVQQILDGVTMFLLMASTKKKTKNKWNLLNVPWVVLILATSSKPLPRKVSRVQRSRIVSGLLWTLHVGFVLLFVLWVFLCALQPLPNTCASALSVTRKGEPGFGFWISWAGTSWMWF